MNFRHTTNRLIIADVLDGLTKLPDESVHCVVTSPPYWGLREYRENGKRLPGQIGLEKTPEEYVEKIVRVFREVRRVLRSDGTCWVNLGDAYAHTGACGGSSPVGNRSYRELDKSQQKKMKYKTPSGLKPKDLCGIPWRVAFALQADGWTLRSDIIWAKKNCMPESCRDRPTKSHEYIFMFSKAKWVGPKPRQFDHISNEDARWLALFLDTEGNICAKRARYKKSGNDHFGTQISFGSTSADLLGRAKEIIGRGVIAERPGKNAPVFYYQLSNIQAADLLYRLYPHLIVKKRQAALGIYLQTLIASADQERRTKAGRLRGRLRDDDYTEELIKIWSTMKELNHFGNPDLSWLPLPQYGHWDSQPYFYDQEAVREAAQDWGTRDRSNWSARVNANDYGQTAHSGCENVNFAASGRNLRSVWTFATQAYPDYHYATFPESLPSKCIRAGTSEWGCCRSCGAPWVRHVKKSGGTIGQGWHDHSKDAIAGQRLIDQDASHGRHGKEPYQVKTLGFRPSCDCPDNQPIPCIVLDPFIGSGTSALVAEKLGRRWIGIDLGYKDLVEKRLHGKKGMRQLWSQ